MRFMKFAVLVVVVVVCSAAAGRGKAKGAKAMGPLGVHPENRRYFQNRATGEVVYLTGSDTWSNLVDIGPTAVSDRRVFDNC
jgi:hypothetical protein